METLPLIWPTVIKIPHMAQRKSKKAGKAEKMTSGKPVSFYEASERLGVSYWTLWRGAEAGFFKTLYVGSRRMIPALELERIAEYGFGGRKRRPREEKSTAGEAR